MKERLGVLDNVVCLAGEHVAARRVPPRLLLVGTPLLSNDIRTSGGGTRKLGTATHFP